MSHLQTIDMQIRLLEFHRVKLDVTQGKLNQVFWFQQDALRDAFDSESGRRGTASFKFVCDQMLKLRRMISDIRQKQSEVDSRVWNLEPHTKDEHFERIQGMITQLSEDAKEIEASIKKDHQ